MANTEKHSNAMALLKGIAQAADEKHRRDAAMREAGEVVITDAPARCILLAGRRSPRLPRRPRRVRDGGRDGSGPC